MAKAEKQAVARQYGEGDLFGGDQQLSSGASCLLQSCLLQSCSTDEVSLLTGQVCSPAPLLLPTGGLPPHRAVL